MRFRYHHTGIPTESPRSGETYLEKYRLHCTDNAANPFGIQRMRYELAKSLPEDHACHARTIRRDLEALEIRFPIYTDYVNGIGNCTAGMTLDVTVARHNSQSRYIEKNNHVFLSGFMMAM